MSEIPTPTVVCQKDGEEVEREIDYFENPKLTDRLRGMPSYPVPKLLPGEEVRYLLDGTIVIIEVSDGHSI